MSLLLQTKFNPNVIYVDLHDIILLTNNLLYHYKDETLKIYNRSDVKITYSNDSNTISIIEYLDNIPIPITIIHIYEEILNYLHQNLQNDEYLEFEKLLFDRS